MISKSSSLANENVTEEVLSFLCNSIQRKDTGEDIETTLEKHLLDKISIDTTSKEENKVDKKLVQHLGRPGKSGES